eukprot:Blabericola_migrator_1__2133@NODE_158_length_12591_cov_218_325775_g138_i0_p4_GENE_NODE_158_length_12591_cov_218_325775_g138_i0NODE_158_length_12591_cov_218_325775_g138_i0_p4_ORF_typecomplete_len204_score24_60TMEM51/PF15345_6/2_1e06LapA_dom/PF06305_11/0_002PSI/PF01437_25/0_0049Shisa/PF13908_6/0_0091Herpes_gE/PF02480_16/3e03Herpes_gE/PF02480_16/0_016DUF4381/PF14316_6/0_033PMP1_2/PF08114_11/0_054Sensor/PF13796_6/0_036DUF2269/PF10027_9/0_05FUSClike/PF12805_7/0_093Glycophorin_A/PF01102_18/0_14Tmp39/P
MNGHGAELSSPTSEPTIDRYIKLQRGEGCSVRTTCEACLALTEPLECVWCKNHSWCYGAAELQCDGIVYSALSECPGESTRSPAASFVRSPTFIVVSVLLGLGAIALLLLYVIPQIRKWRQRRQATAEMMTTTPTPTPQPTPRQPQPPQPVPEEPAAQQSTQDDGIMSLANLTTADTAPARFQQGGFIIPAPRFPQEFDIPAK